MFWVDEKGNLIHDHKTSRFSLASDKCDDMNDNGVDQKIFADLAFKCLEFPSRHLLFVFSPLAPLCFIIKTNKNDNDLLTQAVFNCPAFVQNVREDASNETVFWVKTTDHDDESRISVVIDHAKNNVIMEGAALFPSALGLKRCTDALPDVLKRIIWKQERKSEYIAQTYTVLLPFVDVFVKEEGVERDARFLFRVPLSDYLANERLFEFFEHDSRVWLFANNMHSNFTFYACDAGGQPMKTVFPFDFFVSKYFRVRDWLVAYGWIWGPIETMYVFDLPGLLSNGRSNSEMLKPITTMDDGYQHWREDIIDGNERVCRLGVDLDVDKRALEAVAQGRRVTEITEDREKTILDVEPWNVHAILAEQRAVLDRFHVIHTDDLWKKNDSALKRLLLRMMNCQDKSETCMVRRFLSVDENETMMDIRCFGASSGNDFSHRMVAFLEDVHTIPRGILRDEYIAHRAPPPNANDVDKKEGMRELHDALVFSLVCSYASREMSPYYIENPDAKVAVQNNEINFRFVLTRIPKESIHDRSYSNQAPLSDELTSLKIVVRAHIGDGGTNVSVIFENPG